MSCVILIVFRGLRPQRQDFIFNMYLYDATKTEKKRLQMYVKTTALCDDTKVFIVNYILIGTFSP